MPHKSAESKKSLVFPILSNLLTECPFREFKDNELGQELWGLGPAAVRIGIQAKGTGGGVKLTPSEINRQQLASLEWTDNQTQPLPRSVRYRLSHWVRAEELAETNWQAEIDIADEGLSKMSLHEYQTSYTDILTKSSFCRKVLTACYILERVENLAMEHTWEAFSCVLPPDGWRAKNLIYSPGTKPGGGAQHKPTLSKNGCYLVRLYYVGAWRCVWVSDKVPVDAAGKALLPFLPLTSLVHAPGHKQPILVRANVVYLWPLLLCKALLKLAAPNMNVDEIEGLYNKEPSKVEDEDMDSFDIFHALTGAMSIWFKEKDPNKIWEMLAAEVTPFTWDDDDLAVVSTTKSKSSKKPSAKDDACIKKSFVILNINNSKDWPAWVMPGITPAHAQELIVNMVRDVPVKRPLPEPEVPLWKTYRWVQWARRCGLYDDYDFPRTRYLKLNGFMKLSYALHLLDVLSSDSLTSTFRKEQERPVKVKPQPKASISPSPQKPSDIKQEQREWVRFDMAMKLLDYFRISYSPFMYQFVASTNNPFPRIPTKTPALKPIDFPAPKNGPLYLQVDSSEKNNLRISLSTVHPRIMMNCGTGIVDYVEPVYMIMEVFQLFVEHELSKPYAYIETRGYNTVTATLPIGRHFCRLWVHSRLNFHLAVLSESNLLIGSKDIILAAATRECHWAVKFFDTVKAAFNVWIRAPRTRSNINHIDRDFFASYEPDLIWDSHVVGYSRSFRHWMFRKALQATIEKRLVESVQETVFHQLRFLFMDPDFGRAPRPIFRKIVKENIKIDTALCVEKMQEISGINEILREVTKQRLDNLSSRNLSDASLEEKDKELERIFLQVISEERERILRQHQAATLIQSHWRGVWARKYLTLCITPSVEVVKLLTDGVFGTVEGMSALMNQFFLLYPGAKPAYSVASALGGIYGLQQHSGYAAITPKCTWVPLFQGKFTCHRPVKAHFEVTSSLPYSTIAIYDNDTGEQLEQVFNADLIFNFKRNDEGYTVQGYSTLLKTRQYPKDVSWQLTILSSANNAFHICNEADGVCGDLQLPSCTKHRFEEMFMPNRRNILGGMMIAAHKTEIISFKATTTSPELQLEAYLRKKNNLGEYDTIAMCKGKGNISWPYIKVAATNIKTENPEEVVVKTGKSGKLDKHDKSAMKENIPDNLFGLRSSKSIRVGRTEKSVWKIKSGKMRGQSIEATEYRIEVIAPKGWPLSLDQWSKIESVREEKPSVAPSSVSTKEKGKPSSAKTTQRTSSVFTEPSKTPYDAYTVFECAFPITGNVMARRDDSREQDFCAEKNSWGVLDPKRNSVGEELRHQFREEFLAPPTPIASKSDTLSFEAEISVIDALPGSKVSAEKEDYLPIIERKYLLLPECFKDKFIELPFIEECTKEKNDSPPIIITPEIATAAAMEREARMKAARKQSQMLQKYNENCVLRSLAKRSKLLKTLFTDACFNPNVMVAMDERDAAIMKEIKDRQESMIRKKKEAEAAKKPAESGKKGK